MQSQATTAYKLHTLSFIAIRYSEMKLLIKNTFSTFSNRDLGHNQKTFSNRDLDHNQKTFSTFSNRDLDHNQSYLKCNTKQQSPTSSVHIEFAALAYKLCTNQVSNICLQSLYASSFISI